MLLVSCFFLFATFAVFSISLIDGFILTGLIQASSIYLNCNNTEYSSSVSCIISSFSLGALLNFLFTMRKKKFHKIQEISSDQFGNNPRRIFLLTIIVFLLSWISQFSDISGFEGAISFASTKSNIMIYSLIGIFSNYLNSFLFIIFLLYDQGNHKFSRLLLQQMLIYLLANFVMGLSVAFRVSITSYATKALSPVLAVISWYGLKSLTWQNIKLNRLLLRLRFSKYIFKNLFFIICSFIVFTILLASAIKFNILDIFYEKILSRAESFGLVLNQLDNLHQVYNWNFLYFFHPFLKLFGLSAYSVPVGTYIVGGGNSNWIGGVNVQLPLYLTILSGTIVFGSILSFLFGILSSICVLHAKYIIISRPINSVSYMFYTFLFLSFPLFFIEPSAWGHSLFFFIIICIIAKIFPIVRFSDPHIVNR